MTTRGARIATPAKQLLEATDKKTVETTTTAQRQVLRALWSKYARRYRSNCYGKVTCTPTLALLKEILNNHARYRVTSYLRNTGAYVFKKRKVVSREKSRRTRGFGSKRITFQPKTATCSGANRGTKYGTLDVQLRAPDAKPRQHLSVRIVLARAM